jgi:hypothetical protein
MDPGGNRIALGGAKGTVLLLSGDMMVAPTIQDAASSLGLGFASIGSLPDLGALPAESSDMSLTEPLGGVDGAFMAFVARLQPALIVLDLSSASLPILRWIQRLATSSATRRIPRLAFGPHVNGLLLEEAERQGADGVVRRSQMRLKARQLVAEYARLQPVAQIASGCEAPLSLHAAEGLDLLSAGAYFAAHEILERAWLEAPDETKHLYRALVQTSVIYIHIDRGNLRGAAKLLLRIHTWLDPLPNPCCGIDTEAWRRQIEALRVIMQQGSPPSRSLLRPIPLAEAS